MKDLIAFVVGLALFICGIGMCRAEKRWIEPVVTTKAIGGTKLASSGVGAAGGAATGVLAWLVIGTLGIATGGGAFAIGLPAMAAIGAGGGALAGAAVGSSASTTTTITEVVRSAPAYEPWMWISALAAGVVLMLAAIFD